MDHKRKFLIDELSDDDPFSQVDDYCSKRLKNMEDQHCGEEEDTEEEELYIEEDDPEMEVLYVEVEEKLVEEEDPEEEGVVEEDPKRKCVACRIVAEVLGGPSTAISCSVLLASSKCLNWENFGDSGKALEVNFTSGWFIDNYLTNRRPKHELLGLHSLEFFDQLLAYITCYLTIIVHKLADHLEFVLHLLLLQDPHFNVDGSSKGKPVPEGIGGVLRKLSGSDLLSVF
ncbi:hypothetical protein JCGZ_05008 [Jatropha curcas]|uniref:Uncharacterized protein n=1 Tax=Jatropha curcas TaxID=180498 RepID=A0A067KRL2_JATCU|nr:hypothetical protein JCGZ_05008 [Jatropha curcas]